MRCRLRVGGRVRDEVPAKRGGGLRWRRLKGGVVTIPAGTLRCSPPTAPSLQALVPLTQRAASSPRAQR